MDFGERINDFTKINSNTKLIIIVEGIEDKIVFDKLKIPNVVFWASNGCDYWVLYKRYRQLTKTNIKVIMLIDNDEAAQESIKWFKNNIPTIEIYNLGEVFNINENIMIEDLLAENSANSFLKTFIKLKEAKKFQLKKTNVKQDFIIPFRLFKSVAEEIAIELTDAMEFPKRLDNSFWELLGKKTNDLFFKVYMSKKDMLSVERLIHHFLSNCNRMIEFKIEIAEMCDLSENYSQILKTWVESEMSKVTEKTNLNKFVDEISINDEIYNFVKARLETNYKYNIIPSIKWSKENNLYFNNRVPKITSLLSNEIKDYYEYILKDENRKELLSSRVNHNKDITSETKLIILVPNIITKILFSKSNISKHGIVFWAIDGNAITNIEETSIYLNRLNRKAKRIFLFNSNTLEEEKIHRMEDEFWNRNELFNISKIITLYDLFNKDGGIGEIIYAGEEKEFSDWVVDFKKVIREEDQTDKLYSSLIKSGSNVEFIKTFTNFLENKFPNLFKYISKYVETISLNNKDIEEISILLQLILKNSDELTDLFIEIADQYKINDKDFEKSIENLVKFIQK